MQAAFITTTDKVAMITAADLGDPESPYGDIHPRNKTEGMMFCSFVKHLLLILF